MLKSFVILDFGSQVTQLIARRLRDMDHSAVILPFSAPLSEIHKHQPPGIILSGGPCSVFEAGAPQRDLKEILSLAPTLGICYGMQLIAHQLGGQVKSAQDREYGFNQLRWESTPSAGAQSGGHSIQKVWMSHGDVVMEAPKNFTVTAKSENHHAAAISGEHAGKKVWAVQFHPEVTHTEYGTEFLKRFAEDVCHAEKNWTSQARRDEIEKSVRAQVAPDDHVLCALSGGVDSSVVATVLTRVLGRERVHCVFVDNGLLRKEEFKNVQAAYEKLDLNVIGIDASETFLSALKGVSDPERKRKIIGATFVEVFEGAIQNHPRLQAAKKNLVWLAQGTLYPDVIESVSVHGGPSHTIKSHHNVGGLPDRMKLKLLEPVRHLFKDEVRRLGFDLGLSKEFVERHPFPGPGLSIRIIGEVNEKSLHIMREADAIFVNLLKERGLYHKIWQAFCVLLPVQTVGVQGDGRTYDQVLALRAVTSTDGMTADWYPFEFDFLRECSGMITSRVKGVSRIVYDVTSKPPATIEWE